MGKEGLGDIKQTFWQFVAGRGERDDVLKTLIFQVFPGDAVAR